SLAYARSITAYVTAVHVAKDATDAAAIGSQWVNWTEGHQASWRGQRRSGMPARSANWRTSQNSQVRRSRTGGRTSARRRRSNPPSGQAHNCWASLSQVARGQIAAGPSRAREGGASGRYSDRRGARDGCVAPLAAWGLLQPARAAPQAGTLRL